MRALVAGGCGFIGSHFVHHLLGARPHATVLVFDKLTYAGNLANLEGLAHDPRFVFRRGDLADRGAVEQVFRQEGPFDLVVNFAAESHVDRSIVGPAPFVATNVEGAFNLLDAWRRSSTGRFVQISSDEVYGSLGDTGRFTEASPLNPSSPYSATKAAADLLVAAYHRTYGCDVLVTRSSNNYGPRQFPEKLIPMLVLKALARERLPIYGTGNNVRDWIHVEDHCRGLLRAIEHGRAGEVYHFGGECERTNLEVARAVAAAVGGDPSRIELVADRPGHDWRYALDLSKARTELGWSPGIAFDQGLGETIAWYVAHEDWWRPILTREHLGFVDRWPRRD